MKLSIITINYNNLEGLKRTYDSVVSQTCQDFEWIIIDGGSTDGSKEFIEEHQDKFAYWCSEPDRGVYHAMNKGIAQAKGEYLNFMNSGDCFVDNKVVEEFIALGWDEDYIAGDVILDGEENKVRTSPIEDELDFIYMKVGGLFHQSSFMHRDLFERFGFYDENMKIAADWKFAFDILIINNCSYRHWDRKVADYDTSGISGLDGNLELHIAERAKVLSQYKRIISSIEKRDKRIRELDLPVMMIFRQKACKKLKSWFHLVKCM
jgi:glycosyltransferase involved in cell wall biosynthesis